MSDVDRRDHLPRVHSIAFNAAMNIALTASNALLGRLSVVGVGVFQRELADEGKAEISVGEGK